MTRMMPRVLVYSEVSADGKTTHARGASSKPMMAFEDDLVRRFRHEQRVHADAIMVGSGTIRIDNPHLTVRHVAGPNPLRVVPASRGLLPLDSHIFTDGSPTLVAVSELATEEAVTALTQAGAMVFRTGVSQVDLSALLSELAQRGINNLMVEGGATLLASLFDADLVDRLVVQHLPVIFGGSETPAMVGGRGLSSVEQAHALELVEVQRLGGHAVITYECGRDRRES